MAANEKELFLQKREQENSKPFALFAFFISLSFFASVPAALWYTGEHAVFWDNFFRILISPSKLVTDYFNLGCLASTLFNAGLCGLACNFMILITHTRANAKTFAAYILVIAHCFYGLNFLNMWPPFIGVLIYCLITKNPIRKNLHITMFSTALAPFVSDLLFRYTVGQFHLGIIQLSVPGVIFAIVFGTVCGFVIPALLPGIAAMQRGYNMYQAGLAVGIFGIAAHAFLYRTLGFSSPDVVVRENPVYDSFNHSYILFMDIFFLIMFMSSIVLGFFMNGKNFHGYRLLTRCTGYGLDFADKFGMPVCFINFGVYGLCILSYLNMVFMVPEILQLVFPSIILPESAGFTGPTVGVLFAALTFSADGQHPRNVAPIVLGYILLFSFVCIVCTCLGEPLPWMLSSQEYVNGLAFATGLCPIAGKYGWKKGVISGILHAVICTSTSGMHGGFVLYNGGFTAGLTALIMIPVLDSYHIYPKYEDDD
ncbi:MAG: DUF1576 domain-containing protein [Clostridia bacterium]|nr:DUF1576 domain-containing protein [Clostridia bacterium]